MPKLILFALALFLWVQAEGDPHLKHIKLLIGEKNFKKLDVKKIRTFSNKKDTVLIIPLLGKKIEREFLITDLKARKKCFWIRLEKETSQSLNADTNSRVTVSSANYSEKRILYIDSKGIVLKEACITNNKLVSSTVFHSINSNEKSLDIALAPFNMKIYPSPVEQLSLINLEWIINLSVNLRNQAVNSSTFVNRFISLEGGENKITEIEFDNS